MSHPRARVLAASTAAVASLLLLFLPGAGAAAAPAGADTYRAEASASALDINLFGQSFSVGKAQATADSTPSATADGAGAIVATQSIGSSTASASAVGQQSGSDQLTCSPLVLPAQVPLLDLATACSSSQASIGDAGPSARAVGQSIDLDLSGDAALSALPIADLTDQISDSLLGGLPPLVGVFPVPPALIVDQLSTLLQQAITADGVSVLSVTGGDATADASVDADSADAGTTSGGLTVKVLDRSGLGLAPILTVEVGTSNTSVTRNRSTGATTANESAIPVSVTVAPDVAALLQLPQSSFDAPEGQQVDLPLPTPLTSSITVTGGSTKEIEGGMRADAGSVVLDLLQGLNGGVQIGLSAGSSSVVGAVPAANTPTPTTTAAAPAPTVPTRGPGVALTTLPRTGVEQSTVSTVALVLLASALAVGGLVWASARRSRTARS